MTLALGRKTKNAGCITQNRQLCCHITQNCWEHRPISLRQTGRNFSKELQESIPVGIVPPTSVATTRCQYLGVGIWYTCPPGYILPMIPISRYTYPPGIPTPSAHLPLLGIPTPWEYLPPDTYPLGIPTPWLPTPTWVYLLPPTG